MNQIMTGTLFIVHKVGLILKNMITPLNGTEGELNKADGSKKFFIHTLELPWQYKLKKNRGIK